MEKELQVISDVLESHEARLQKLEGDRGYVQYVDDKVKGVVQRLKRQKESQVFQNRMMIGVMVLQVAPIIFLLAVWR